MRAVTSTGTATSATVTASVTTTAASAIGRAAPRARTTAPRAKARRGGAAAVEVDVVVDDDRDDTYKGGAREHRARARATAMTLSTLAAFALADAIGGGSCAAALYDGATFDDPVEPFTIYGTVEKQFAINVMDESGRKIIGRRRGMTATACANVVPASSIPGNGRPPRALRAPACSTATAEGEITNQKQMLPACAPACKASCSAGLQEYIDGAKATTGFGLGKEQRDKVMRACLTTCGKDCTKSGKFYDFIIPFRF